MQVQHNHQSRSCPVDVASVRADVQTAFDKLVQFCCRSDDSFRRFEMRLFVLMAALGVQLIRLFLTARHERLDVEPHLEDGNFRRGDDYAERTLKTAYGEVTYGRHYLTARRGGSGVAPLDIDLGLTRDKLTPWMMQWVARLATRMSFAAARRICKAVLNWSPATETIEQVVLGLGREAAPFMEQLKAPENDGGVLVIEVDGKCPPTATQAELDKRRGKRRQHGKACECGCQRHRGQAKRRRRGSKKRRKKGDKSKNGKEVMVVVMYTLKRGDDGRLHGPINKKLWASFAGRKAAAKRAREEATKRGFGPETTKTVQIVVDGANGLENNLAPLFPNAIVTLDVIHVVERLWSLGRHFHREGSEELKEWVEELKGLLYQGKAKTIVKRLYRLLRQVPMNGPGTQGRRAALETLIGYMEPRLEMMHYGDWRAQDLVIASGQVEGAVRHLVGERFDCAGMRWVPGKAEALLHLRCIELNGDWEQFAAWAHRRTHAQLRKRKTVKVLTDQPLTITKVL